MRQNNFRIFKELRAGVSRPLRRKATHAPRMRCMRRFTSFPTSARIGGASRDRTDDPLLAKQVLSQLSYGP